MHDMDDMKNMTGNIGRSMGLFNIPQNFSILMGMSVEPESVITLQKSIVPGILDGILALILPVVAYWSYSMFFHIIDVYQLAEMYRIHPSEEEESRNKASMRDVIKDVILQHIIQTVFGYIMVVFDPPQVVGYEVATMWRLKKYYLPSFVPDSVLWVGYMYGWPFFRLCVAVCIIDTWQYWLHRIMHMNKTLYRRFHSRHHRLYVPYAFGALYNDPIEGLLLDSMGTGLAAIATGLSHRESAILYTFATLKTVDDHCGYRIPFDLFQIIFPNNSVYHDIHHQSWGIKNNFSQPFFTFWDKTQKTQYQFVNEYKSLQKHITLTKYKQFLDTKKRKAAPVTTEKEDKKNI